MRNSLGQRVEIAEPGGREPRPGPWRESGPSSASRASFPGVGSRPFVSEPAARLGLTGRVRNESQGAVGDAR